MENVLLLIEDDQDQSDILVRHLFKDFYVNCAFDAKEGIKSIYSRYPHLIIIDLQLPTISGVDTIKELKKNFETRTIPIIAISAHDEMGKEAVACGAQAYLRKPIDNEALRQTMRQVLNQKLSVLFVDDDNDILDLLSETFGRKYEAIVCLDGEEAYDIYLKKSVNLVVTDIAMTKVSGIKLIKKIRQNDQRTPLIVTSGVRADELKDCMHCGADNILEKPFDVYDLEHKIQKVLKTHFPLHFELNKK